MVEHENHANVTKPVGTILSGNTIAQNAAILASVVVEQGQDSLYEYNTIYTSGAGGGTLTTLNSQGGYATGSVSASFYNNTLYLGVTAFGNGLELDTASNPIFENNIVFTANPGTWNGYIVSLPATGVTGLVSDYNNLSDSQYVSGSTYATSLAAWKTLSGQDAHSIDLNPLFIDAPGHNFALQGGSPASRRESSSVACPRQIHRRSGATESMVTALLGGRILFLRRTQVSALARSESSL